MNPQALIPVHDPYGIPAPVWLFVFLMNLTLVLHFLAMGYVFATTLLHVFLAPVARPASTAEWMLRRTEGPLPVALSFTITLGVAPLLFVQVLYQPVFYPANILLGYQWFGIIGVLMFGFYLIYLLWGGRCLGRPIAAPLRLLGRLTIFATIAYVLVTMTANAIVTMAPEAWPAIRESGGNFLLAKSPILWPRMLHNFLAALIIGGVWWIALGARSERIDSGPIAHAGGMALRKLGALVVMAGALLQAGVGIWLVMAEKPEVRTMLFSGRPAAILWMTALLGVLGLCMLGLWSLTKRPGKTTLALWGVLGLVLGGMFAAREAAREIHLAPYLKLTDWAVKPQISSLILFLVFFVLALGIIGMMIRWMIVGWRNGAAEN